MSSAGTPEGNAVERIGKAHASRQAGRYAEALALLSASEEWPAPENERATLMRAHILARTAPARALALLARSQDLVASELGRFNYYVISMRAYIGTRNYEAAAGMSELASGLEAKAPIADRCLLWHQRALLRQCLQQYDVHDENITALIGSADPNGQYLGHMIRSYMYAGLRQYDEQAEDLKTALGVAMSHPGSCDPLSLAVQVHALLRLGLERGDRTASGVAADAYEWMPWSDDLKGERFLCVRALAWDAFLRGESAQAQWLLKDSKELAASDGWKVMAHLDRAYIARMNGNEHWAAEELLTAHTIARGVEWSSTTREERQALVMMAVLYSPTDMAQAQHYVSTYIALGRENVDPTWSLPHDVRPVAFESYALGRVQQVLGNETIAIKAFEKAYDIFDAAGYRFRAALAAMGLFETTHDPTWLDRARRHAETFPNSALAATLKNESIADENARLRELSPMQRQIAFALCEGLELAEMSQRFSRSAYTLSKHVETVYQRLGVKNRSALRTTVQSWTYV